MTKQLKELLETVVTGNNDLWKQTIIAAEILLQGGYKGYEEDLEYIEDRKIENGFDFENIIAQGSWYFQETETWKEKFDEIEGKNENLCPECNVYCKKRFIDGQCE